MKKMKKEKWVLRTEYGDIDVSHLSPEDRLKAQNDLVMMNWFYDQARRMTIEHLAAPITRREK